MVAEASFAEAFATAADLAAGAVLTAVLDFAAGFSVILMTLRLPSSSSALRFSGIA